VAGGKRLALSIAVGIAPTAFFASLYAFPFPTALVALCLSLIGLGTVLGAAAYEKLGR